MRKSIILTVCLLVSTAIMAQKSDQEAIRRKINKAAMEMHSMECDFVQTKHLKMLNDKLVSKGKMSYQQKDKLRWEYTSPYTYTFILNGTKVLLKNNRRNDVIDTNQNKMFREIARVMMNSVVGNCLNDGNDYKADISTEGGDWVARLTPLKKNMRQMFQSIVLRFDRQRGLVKSVELVEKNGDRTMIELKNVKTNHAINPKTFSVG